VTKDVSGVSKSVEVSSSTGLMIYPHQTNRRVLDP